MVSSHKGLTLVGGFGGYTGDMLLVEEDEQVVGLRFLIEASIPQCLSEECECRSPLAGSSCGLLYAAKPCWWSQTGCE